MTASLTKIAGSFPKACRTVVFCKSEAVGFGYGDFDDMIAVKPLQKPVSAASIFIDGKSRQARYSVSQCALQELQVFVG